MKIIKTMMFLLIIPISIYSQRSIDKIVSDSILIRGLNSTNGKVIEIQEKFFANKKEEALKELALYFADKMSERYFFDWKNFYQRLDKFKKGNDNFTKYYKRAAYQMNLFSANPKWELPSLGKDGSKITPYKLRHLARQHEALDIVLVYYLENESVEYKDYLIGQVNSLADNFVTGSYDKKGNAIFESFRAGYRVFNWLYVYNFLLASDKFTWREQIDFIKTFYYHADVLDRYANKFRYGNHHTKGLMAQSLISIFFPEFDKSNYWLDRTLALLTEHLTKEITNDGFQFERSVHYHMGDIDNFFYVYYLAKLNDVKIPNNFKIKFQSMFEALMKIALPNKKLPVLQDDTDIPWAEFNDMSKTMVIGTILFDKSEYKYFADEKISSKLFWLLRENDIKRFAEMESVRPNIGSIALPDVGYYVMRSGWDKDDFYSVISNGISKYKPDHQHGDMLSIYAYGNENIILPNYQCRYFLTDYKFFKNSFVKNVAIVDSIPQGQKWKGNSGGSGFGKWLELPKPISSQLYDDSEFSLFVGSHDGYEKLGVKYWREIVFIKSGFWIVVDKFESKEKRKYQQVWQGHYNSKSNGNAIRSTFADGSGLDIVQLNTSNYSLDSATFRGKGNFLFSSEDESNFTFVTLLHPFKNFDYRYNGKNPSIKGWKVLGNEIRKNNISIVFGKKAFKDEKIEIEFGMESDFIIFKSNNEYSLILISNNSDQLNYKYSNSEMIKALKVIQLNKQTLKK